MMDEFHMRSYIDRLERDRTKLLQRNVDLECEVAKLKSTIDRLNAFIKQHPPPKNRELIRNTIKLKREDTSDTVIDEIAKMYDDIKSVIGFLFIIIGTVCLLSIIIAWIIERLDVIHPIIYVLFIMSILVQLIIIVSPSKEYCKKILRLKKEYKKDG